MVNLKAFKIFILFIFQSLNLKEEKEARYKTLKEIKLLVDHILATKKLSLCQ
jgi:hypothetical protein